MGHSGRGPYGSSDYAKVNSASTDVPSIPLDWIRQYVNRLLVVSSGVTSSTDMKTSLQFRAEAIIDMVEAFNKSA
jgi:hypothetical protein